MKTVKAIFACDQHGGFGMNGALPWCPIKEDLKRFKALTKGHVVVMGRGTYEAKDMPVPLPARTNVVLSRTLSKVKEGLFLMRSLEEIIETFPEREIWMIGGASIIESALSQISQIELSVIQGRYEADRFLNLNKVLEGFKMEENITSSDEKVYFQSWIKITN